MTNLASLHLTANIIGAEGARALLETWVDLANADHLEFLDLRENGDLSSVLPAEVLETTDAQAILAAYRKFRLAAAQETLRPLNEAKLLVVGNEAVGKTSLIRYLVENKPRDPSEPKTPGTAIREKIETRTWSPRRQPGEAQRLGLRRPGDHAWHASVFSHRAQPLSPGAGEPARGRPLDR